jgi:hypothetical protein
MEGEQYSVVTEIRSDVNEKLFHNLTWMKLENQSEEDVLKMSLTLTVPTGLYEPSLPLEKGSILKWGLKDYVYEPEEEDDDDENEEDDYELFMNGLIFHIQEQKSDESESNESSITYYFSFHGLLGSLCCTKSSKINESNEDKSMSKHISFKLDSRICFYCKVVSMVK